MQNAVIAALIAVHIAGPNERIKYVQICRVVFRTLAYILPFRLMQYLCLTSLPSQIKKKPWYNSTHASAKTFFALKSSFKHAHISQHAIRTKPIITSPSAYTCKHAQTPRTHTRIHTYTHTKTHCLPNFYWTRIQLLNPASGSVPSLLLHLDKSALISADSRCPPSTPSSHTPLTHTSIQLIPIRVWLNEKCDAHFSIPGSMNTNERQISQSLVCERVYVCVCEWQRERRGELVSHFHAFL